MDLPAYQNVADAEDNMGLPSYQDVADAEANIISRSYAFDAVGVTELTQKSSRFKREINSNLSNIQQRIQLQVVRDSTENSPSSCSKFNTELYSKFQQRTHRRGQRDTTMNGFCRHIVLYIKQHI